MCAYERYAGTRNSGDLFAQETAARERYLTDRTLPSSIEELRTVLFIWQRRCHNAEQWPGAEVPDAESASFGRALVAAIGSHVAVPAAVAAAKANPYHPAGTGAAKIASIFRAVTAVLELQGVDAAHIRSLLNVLIWHLTEADGKYTCRYQSSGALTAPKGAKLNHEHVVPRKALIDRLLKAPGEQAEILGQAVACVVTKTEHERLSALKAPREGWDRYRAAGVRVIDRMTAEPHC
ncbi:MAG: hypothetical protein WD232_07040 [Acidimicrobiales bacterium]